MSDCPLCNDDEVCLGKHCLVELDDVIATVHSLKKGDAVWDAALETAAGRLAFKYDFPPAAQHKGKSP